MEHINFILQTMNSAPTSAIIFAILLCNEKTFKFILENNPDLNIRYGKKLETPLMVALRTRRLAYARLLLNAGANVMLETLNGKDAFDYCNDQDLKDEILSKYKIDNFGD
jgi:ankyrin repeat protein